MAEGEKIDIIISELDLYLINKVREIRIKKKISQNSLSQSMELADGFISKVENPKERAKYNIRHLNLLTKILKVTWMELLPEEPFKNDLVKVTYRRQKKPLITNDGPLYKIIKKSPLTEEEIKLFNKGML